MKLINRNTIYLIMALTLCSLLFIPVTESTITKSAALATNGIIQTNPTDSFTIKSAQVSLNVIQYKNGDNPMYVSNWASILHGLGVNTLRLDSGGYGDTWGINMIENPTTWAQNLENILTLTNANGFKVWFQSLGGPYGTNFGIDDLNLGVDRFPALVRYDMSRTDLSLNDARIYIDKLAGNNALGHNFITDPRILAWSIGNECYMGTKNWDGTITTNNVYTWVTGVMDYIRTKGGQVIADCPLLAPGWNQEFADTVPLFEAHADYMERHEYVLYPLVNNYNLGGGNYNWAGWKAETKNILSEQMSHRGSFPADHVILGEFGLWHGYGSDGGVTATFTDQNCIDYYTNYLQALKESGYKCVSFFSAFTFGSPTGTYGMINVPNGQLLAGCEVIRTNFS